MKLISYDVGIRNMAYCIFVIENNSISIVDWDIVNLMENHEIPIKTCCFEMPVNKRVLEPSPKICGKKASYEKTDRFYCTTHAKKQTKVHGWILPNKDLRTANLKKMNIDELYILGKQYSIFQEDTQPKTKKVTLSTILEFFQDRMMSSVSQKRQNAGEVDLITLGISMKSALDKMDDVTDLTHVIIENQISPIATRMKTIQGMLAQYYIMKYDPSNLHVEFISSSNKLKHLVKTTSAGGNETNSYKQNKQDSIYFCKIILEENESLNIWSHVLDTSKKDDLADCFLQGLYYLQHRKLISYAENLNIKCVTLS
jgi:hypothetical protein